MADEKKTNERPSAYIARGWDQEEWMHRVATMLDVQDRELKQLAADAIGKLIKRVEKLEGRGTVEWTPAEIFKSKASGRKQ